MSTDLKTFVSLLRYDNVYNHITVDVNDPSIDDYLIIFNDYIKYYKLKHGNTINFDVQLKLLFKLKHCLDSIEPLITHSINNILYSQPYFIMKKHAYDNNLTLLSHISLNSDFTNNSYKYIKNSTLDNLCEHVYKMVVIHEEEIEDEIIITYNCRNIMFKIDDETYIEVSNTDVIDGESIKKYLIKKYFNTV